MSSNLIQFAPIFDAVGAKINLRTVNLEAEILEYPRGKKQVIIDAVGEVDKFLDTKTYNDGVAIFGIAEFIDGDPNPIHINARLSILENLGLMKEGRYISQVLALQKSNKSWHSSEKPNQCTYFGDICTKRGIEEVAGKRGRKSTRSPEDYHVMKSNDTINREQLVTPALEQVHRSIPADMLISVSPRSKNIIHLDRIDELEPEELELILNKIRAMEKKSAV